MSARRDLPRERFPHRVRLAEQHAGTLPVEPAKKVVSRSTSKLHFRDLVERKLIAKHGRGREAWYGLA